MQGCTHNCIGCHNPSTHDKTKGYFITTGELKEDISQNLIITGVTFTGGEPLQQMAEVISLAKWAKENSLTTTLYTGYTVNCNRVENVSANARKVYFSEDILNTFDYIIDGKFEIKLKSVDLPFRGSYNQRILTRGIDY